MLKKVLFYILAILGSFFVFKYVNFNPYLQLPKLNNFLDYFVGVSDILLLIYLFREVLPNVVKFNWFWVLFGIFLVQGFFGGFSVFGLFLTARLLSWIWLFANNKISAQLKIVLFFYGLFDHLLLTSSLPILCIFWLLNFGKNKFLDKALQLILLLNIFLATFQILAQKSLGIFGEPVLSSEIFGIAKQEFGSLRIIKGYGLFQHPNILGSVGVILLFWKNLNFKFWGLVLGLLSMSRLAYFGVAFWVFGKIKNNVTKWFLGLSFGIFMSFWFFLRTPADMGRWVDLQNFTSLIWSFNPQNWLFGAGDYPREISKLTQESWQWQPVHNVFLLIFAEFGLVGITSIIFATKTLDKK